MQSVLWITAAMLDEEALDDDELAPVFFAAIADIFILFVSGLNAPRRWLGCKDDDDATAGKSSSESSSLPLPPFFPLLGIPTPQNR
ncbi:hypothetical protein GEV01_26210 [Rugamonas sp. FT103W]|uniref:Uncharacterized protein n=2 Tax=Rugamonas rivuli TaxID=2743358 RepID=A0A843SFF9_9BURK|nr:hypothetical protein [Rugamonas rivuli]